MSAQGSPKKARKPRPKAAHPSTVEMVTAAIGVLKERGGSSLAAIKKYMASNYKVDAGRLAPFIRACLKKGVASGVFVQKNGTGASGRFRIGVTKKAKKPKQVKKVKKAKAKKPKKAKKAKKAKKVKKPKAKKAKAKKAVKPKKAAKKPAKKAAKKSAKKVRKPKAKKSPKKSAK